MALDELSPDGSTAAQPASAPSPGRTPEVDYLQASRRLRVQRHIDGEAVAVALEGELDLETAAELDRQLADLDRHPVSRVLIDLRSVSFIDSRGLAAILRAQRAAETRGCAFVLRPGPRQVQRLFEVAGLEPRLTFDED